MIVLFESAPNYIRRCHSTEVFLSLLQRTVQQLTTSSPHNPPQIRHPPCSQVRNLLSRGGRNQQQPHPPQDSRSRRCTENPTDQPELLHPLIRLKPEQAIARREDGEWLVANEDFDLVGKGMLEYAGEDFGGHGVEFGGRRRLWIC